MMKRFLLSSLLALAFLCGFSFAQETTFDPMAMPAIGQYVEDFSKVMTPLQLTDLRSIAYRHSTQTSNQIVTVLFPSRDGNNLLDIGVKLFNENGIGQKAKDNGLLLLIVTEEKKLRIVVGYGMEDVITDATSKKIVEAIRPNVNSGDYYGAIKQFYALVLEKIQTAQTQYTGETSTGTSFRETSKNLDWWVLMVLLGIVGGIILPFWKKRKITMKVKTFFGGRKHILWLQILGIIGSYIFILTIIGGIYTFINYFPAFISNFLGAFIPSFLVSFLLALIPPGTFKGKSGGAGFGGLSSASNAGWSSGSDSSSSSSSSSDSGGFDGGGGDSGGGGAGDD